MFVRRSCVKKRLLAAFVLSQLLTPVFSAGAVKDCLEVELRPRAGIVSRAEDVIFFMSARLPVEDSWEDLLRSWNALRPQDNIQTFPSLLRVFLRVLQDPAAAPRRRETSLSIALYSRFSRSVISDQRFTFLLQDIAAEPTEPESLRLHAWSLLHQAARPRSQKQQETYCDALIPLARDIIGNPEDSLHVRGIVLYDMWGHSLYHDTLAPVLRRVVTRPKDPLAPQAIGCLWETIFRSPKSPPPQNVMSFFVLRFLKHLDASTRSHIIQFLRDSPDATDKILGDKLFDWDWHHLQGTFDLRDVPAEHLTTICQRYIWPMAEYGGLSIQTNPSFDHLMQLRHERQLLDRAFLWLALEIPPAETDPAASAAAAEPRPLSLVALALSSFVWENTALRELFETQRIGLPYENPVEGTIHT